MNTKNDGGPAYPCEGGDMSGLVAHPGMTMRQYYKAAALGSLNAEMLFSLRDVAKKANITNGQTIAGYCGEIADALLAEDERHAKE